MARKSKTADKELLEFQEAAAERAYREPLTLLKMAIRGALDAEAQELETQLASLGIEAFEREAIYRGISARREELEKDLDAPGAYERYLARAEVAGLLKRPRPEVAQ
jgi:hypothetical protein